MKNKKYILISCLTLLAILISACASVASASPAQTVDSQAAAVESKGSNIVSTELQTAPGSPASKVGPDLEAAAGTLGVTVEVLQQALQDAMPADCSAGTPDCHPDLTAAATTLGITAEELQAALGGPANGERQGGPDFEAAANTLGITVEELQQALQDAKPTDCTPETGDCHPDLTVAATTLGITAEELQAALGGPANGERQGGPDFETAASDLGITAEELQQALQDAKPTNCIADSKDCRPDLTAAATALGITAEELQAALGNPHQGEGQTGNGQPGQGGPGNGQQPPQDGQGNNPQTAP